MKRFQSMRFSSLIRTKNFIRYGLLCLIVCIISLYIYTYHHDNVIQTIFDITENQEGKTDLERIEARLQSYQQRRRNQCGNFLYKKYLPKLNKIKENGTLFDSPTILFIPPLSGMSDCIAGALSLFLVSLLTNRNFVYWNRDFIQDALIDSYNFPNIPSITTLPPPFDIMMFHKFPWHRGDKLEKGKYDFVKIEFERNLPNNKVSKEIFYNGQIQKDLVRRIRQGNATIEDIVPKTVTMAAVMSHLSYILGLFEHPLYKKRLRKEFQLTPQITFGCLFDFIFQPKPQIFLPIYQEFMKLTDPTLSYKRILTISIHLRAGDDILENKARYDLSMFNMLFHCAAQIEKFVMKEGKYSKAIWYVISDNQEFRQMALDRYGPQKIITPINSTLVHSSHAFYNESHLHGQDVYHNTSLLSNGLQTAAAEWWLYGLTDYHVGYKTGFASAAGNHLGYRKNLYLLSYSRRCSRKNYVPLWYLKNYFPGI